MPISSKVSFFCSKRTKPEGEQVVVQAGVILSCTVRLRQLTLPIVGSRSSKDEVVVILVKDGGEALLAGSEHLVAAGPTVAEVPVASVFAGRRIDVQVLTEHVAAADNVPRFDAGVHVVPALVAMGAGLVQKATGQHDIQVRDL